MVFDRCGRGGGCGDSSRDVFLGTSTGLDDVRDEGLADAIFPSFVPFLRPKMERGPVQFMRLAFAGPGSGWPGGGSGCPRPIGFAFVPNPSLL